MLPQQREQLLADVDAYCQELRPSEELCYVEHRYNEQTIELAKKYNLLGMPVPAEYRRPRRRCRDLRPGLGAHRPRRNRRADVLLRPHLDRPIPDHALRQRSSKGASICPARLPASASWPSA